jgi:hypothetical protein
MVQFDAYSSGQQMKENLDFKEASSSVRLFVV